MSSAIVMNFKIFQAQPEDSKTIDEIWRDSVQAVIAKSYPPEIMDIWIIREPYEHEHWREDIRTKSVYILKSESQICGWVMFDEEELHGIFVRNTCQGRGFGTAMFEFAVARMPTRPVKLSSTLNAVSFYDRMGCLSEGMSVVRRKDRDIYVVKMDYYGE